MKLLQSALFATAFAAAGFFAAPAFGQSQPPPPPPDTPANIASLAVPPDVTAASLVRAVEAALAKRQWILKSADNDSVVGYLDHHGYQVTIFFHCQPARIDISVLCYEFSSWTGKLKRTDPPDNWIKNLEGDIQAYYGYRPQQY